MALFAHSNNLTFAADSNAFVFDLNAEAHIDMIQPFSIGDVFYASGNENPSTGYTWNVAADVDHSCGPEGAITFEESYKRDSTLIGAGGIKTVKFTVNPSAKSGTYCQIGLTEGQSWNLPSGWKTQPQ